MNFNPVNPKSDQHLISLYNMYPESHIKVEEMVTREGTFWLANKFSLSAAWKCIKNSVENIGREFNFFFSDSH